MIDQEIQKAIYETINTIVDKKNSQLQFNRTIDCVIESVVDLNTGEYKVRYLDKVFSAFDSNKSNYKVGKTVQVLVPSNDMSAKKTIIGLKSSSAEDLSEVIIDEEQVHKTGIPLEEIYNIPNEPVGIYGSYNGMYVSIFNGDSSKDKLFQSYAKDQDRILITGKFKNWWQKGTILNGNYGINFIFNTIEGEQVNYYTTVEDLTGNIYRYVNYADFAIIFKVDGNKLAGLAEIQFYSKDFKREDELGNPLDLIKTEEELRQLWNQGMSEIWVKDISCSFVKEIDFLGYKVFLSAPRGYYQDLVGSQLLQLKADVKFRGSSEGIEQDRISYWWFKRNIEVSIGSDLYNEIGGIGWELLPDLNTQIITVPQISNKIISKQYKVVAIYNDMRLSDTIVLFSQFQQNRKGELILTYNPNSTAKLTAEMLGFTQEELDSMSYYWTSKDVNGGILIENSNTFELDNIQVVNIVDYKTFQCQVSIPSQDIVLATLEKTIYNTFDDTDYEVFFEVSEGGTYTYDTFGDLYPPQIYEKPITGHTIGFTLSENIGTYSYKWIFPQNSLIITPDGTEPIIGTYYAASENEQSNVVNFVIDTRYDYTKALNNRIQLEITIDKKPRLFYFDIGFIKEGDPGTNGTSLSMKISPTTGSPVTLTPGGQIQLQADIWFNGQPITESNYFNFETSFPRAYKVNNPLIEGGVSIVKNNNIITISDVVLEASVLYDAATGLVENYNSIIQIKAVPNQNGKDAGFNYDVIGLYGIPISNDVDMANSSCRGIKNVIYDSDGHNPSYGKIPFELNDLEPQIIESSTAIRELKNNIVIPRDKFFEDQSRGGIIFRYNDNMNYFISPIVFMANAYSKEILNAWDGSSVDINEEGGYIMAPQIGAGKKNKDNTFTGVLMGVYVNGDEGSHHGLYGFQDGITSFGFKDDGTAFIGKAGTGRIEFDGTFGTITSGNYIKGVSGTRIDLSKGWIDSFNFRLTSKALDLNSENSRFKFDISQDSNGTFKIIGSDKTLLNITNESYYLQSNNFSEGEAGMKINLKNGSIDAKNFSISSSGDASFKGDIEADSGTIGDWVINGGRLESTNGSIKLDAKNNRIIGGSIYIPDIRGSLFSVDEDGKLIATNANISGTINADDGTIGGWYIGDEWIQSMEDKPSNLQNFISLKKGNNAHIQIGAGILYPDSVTLRIVTPSGGFSVVADTNIYLAGEGQSTLRGNEVYLTALDDSVSTLGSNIFISNGSSSTSLLNLIKNNGGGSGGSAIAVFG